MRSGSASSRSAAAATRSARSWSSSCAPKALTAATRVVPHVRDLRVASARGAVDPGRLAAMSATLVHRGPDSDGAFVEGPVGLAARRLAIIDLAGGDQPISNEDGRITVVQNGEIYNYRELRARARARGPPVPTSGDTEVIVHLYEEHGERFVERLRGMFAIALWDAERGRLVLARDRSGSSRSTTARPAASWRSPRSCGRFRAARSTSTRSTRSSRSTRSRRR